MAKANITEYSATAGSNTEIDGTDISEGCSPATINNAIRELMAHLKDMDVGTTSLTSPSGTNITATTALKTPAIQFTDGDAAIQIANGGGVTANDFSSTSVNIDGGAIDGVTLGTNSAVTQAVIDNVNINGSTIGHTSDTDLLTLTSGLLTVAGEVSMTTLDIGGTNVTATATEINIIDGDATVGTTTPVAGDGIVTNDNGTMRQTSVDTFDTYLSQSTKTLTNKTIDADNNTVSNIEVDNLKSGVLDTDLSSVSSSHDTIPSAKATKEFLEASGTASAASASASATSATASATSATAAASSATAAASSATAASTSESNSQTSANSAAASALLAAGAFDSFDDKYLGTMADSDTASSASTTGTFSSGGSQITVASASGIEVGQLITGTNIATGTNVIKISGTTINISEATTGAGSGTSLTFTGHGVFGTFNSSIDGPPTDNDNGTLATGMLYFNTTDGEMRVYDGANWIAASASGSVSFTKYKYVATASQTTFSGTDANSATLSYVTNNIIVALNGVILDATDFTANNGTSVVLGSGAALSDEVTIYAFKSFTVADAVAASTGGTFGGNVVFSGTTTGLDLNGTELILDADGDTSITSDTDDRVDIKVGNQDIVHVTSSALGVGTSSPDFPLDIEGSVADDAVSTVVRISADDPASSSDHAELQIKLGNGASSTATRRVELHALSNNGSDNRNLVINPSGGNLGIGLTTPVTSYGVVTQIHDTGTSGANLRLTDNTSGSGTGNGFEIIQIGVNDFIINRENGFIAIYTNGSEALRIDSSGRFILGKTSFDSSVVGFQVGDGGRGFFTTNTEECCNMNRKGDDGALLKFQQDGTTEGTISVSGSTVSYNGFSGLHESSGIPTNTPIGTIVSTIDELDVYSTKQDGMDGEEVDSPKAGQTRADHSKVEVSDTTGDSAVYGVVASFNAQGKVNVASVGIGSVRVTGACAKGDLLESNGDRTAKVQSDDIVRSKTIGKVTIGNSSTDEKLVSCVLYCG